MPTGGEVPGCRGRAEGNKAAWGGVGPPAAAFSAAFVSRLKAQVQQLSAELQDYKQLKRRVQESTFSKDLQRNLQVTPPGGQARHRTPCCCFSVPTFCPQAHGSPGAFWESEQESLLFVIEMKSEQVQEQSRKLQNVDALVKATLSCCLTGLVSFPPSSSAVSRRRRTWRWRTRWFTSCSRTRT